MPPWRISAGLGLSGVVHLVMVVCIDAAPPSRQAHQARRLIELTSLPSPPSPPTPTPLAPRAQVAPPAQVRVAPKRSEDNTPTRSPAPPRQAAAPERIPLQPAPAGPVALAGVSFSNAGFALPSGNGGGSFDPVAPRPSVPDAVTTTKTRTTSDEPNALTPLSNLSRKPTPPILDGALARNYPPTLRRQGIEGQALVQVFLSKTGRVTHSLVLSETRTGFGDACQRALQASHWTAALDKTGVPVATTLKYRCRFNVGL